ncbi:MAG: hypothetical protein AB8G22_13430, partial [Saprospiraceae bacterium]
MKKNILLLTIFFISSFASAQITVSATSDMGSGYTDFTNGGFDSVESPDCAGGHEAFGAHILRENNAELGKDVFVFYSHIDED